MKDLTKKAGRGVIWSFLSQITQQLIRILSMVVLARILTPKDFGVIAMVSVFTEILLSFKEWGFQAALIQKKDVDEDDKNTAFWSIFIVAFILYAISIGATPFISNFFNEPILKKIIPIITIGFFLTSFGSVQWALLNREMKFKILAYRNISAIIGYSISACIFAILEFGVWSIVYASLLRDFIWGIFLMFACEYSPKFKFNNLKFKSMLNFSINTTLAGFIKRISESIDTMLTGKYLGAFDLGIYNIASTIISIPQIRIISQIESVLFPAYSKINDDKDKIIRAFIITVKTVLIIMIPIISILFVESYDFVFCIFGEKWTLSVIPIKIMCFFGLLRSLTGLTYSIFLCYGRPDIQLKLSIYRLIILTILLYIGVQYGINGVAISVLIFSVLNFFPTFYITNKMINLKNIFFNKIFFSYLLLSCVIIFILECLSIYFLYDFSNLNRLIINSIIGSLIYIILLFVFLKQDFQLIISTVKKVF